MRWIKTIRKSILWAVGILCISLCFVSIATTAHLLLQHKAEPVQQIRTVYVYEEAAPRNYYPDSIEIEIKERELTHQERVTQGIKDQQEQWHREDEKLFWLYNMGDDRDDCNRRRNNW